jgi:hypothetical protein
MTKKEWTIFAAFATVGGLVFGSLGNLWGPRYIIMESSRIQEIFNYVGKAGHVLTAIAPVVWLALDWDYLFRRKENSKVH